MAHTQSAKGMRSTRHHHWIMAFVLLLFVCMAWPAHSATEVKFGVPDWPGEQVKAQVASKILQDIGYETSISNVSWIIGLRGVASGELSVDMALWRPTQNSVLNPMLEDDKVTLLTTNVTDALYGLVVPQYVWDAGVHSIADLAEHADQFDGKILGIEAGNDGNELVQDAIDDDLYGLSAFNLIESSEAAMLSEAGKVIKEQGWIVFLGWKPHWMNVVYDLAFLDDPEEMWGGGSTVNTVVHPDYPDEQPNVTRFIKQMVIPSDVQSQWIYDYGYKEIPAEDVAQDWIQDNLDLVSEWLDGVTTADGDTPAIDAVKAAFD